MQWDKVLVTILRKRFISSYMQVVDNKLNIQLYC